MSPETRPKPSSSWSTTSKTLLTRLSAFSEFRPRFHNLTEFYIRPEEPHRKYSPGDTVKGAVVLTIVKPIRITHLTVCLHGFARVFKNPNSANEPYTDPGLVISQKVSDSQNFGNGYASLFQDEVTLCGEGRLEAGIYEFNFELVFPPQGLPTSIDFERGTISYLITSTITRPTSINATKCCECKVSLVETVDVGFILPPKPQIISIAPPVRRTKRKRSNRSELTFESHHSKTEITQLDDLTSTCTLSDNNSDCQSSEGVNENRSVVDTDKKSSKKKYGGSDVSYRSTLPCLASLIAESQLCRKFMKERKNVTATIELLKSGCLPGDKLPLKITIKHTKPIRSMNGVIITLYRQGRIDSAPPLPQCTNTKGKKAARLKHEEYYPKSKTGLRGLSLTSAGSSSIFRKDLSQTFAPIVVDPTTLTAVIHASIRVPENVFPTICSVPGQMITFKYNIEVIVDLGGRLSGHHFHTPLLRAVTLPLSSKYTKSVGTEPDTNDNMFSTWGRNIVGTEGIKREKSVVTCSFEVIVGSKDSVRSRKRSNSSTSRFMGSSSQNFVGAHNKSSPSLGYNHSCDTIEQENERSQYNLNLPQILQRNSSQKLNSTTDRRSDELPYQDLASLSHTSRSIYRSARQKDAAFAVRQIESSADGRTMRNSSIQETTCLISRPHFLRALTAEERSEAYRAQNITCLSTITSFALSAKSEPSEDKQELEHRRLLAEASAPSFTHEDNDNILQANATSTDATAPVIVDDDSYELHRSSAYLSAPSTRVIHETPPRYQSDRLLFDIYI